jgi:hypothetical protein
LHQERIERSGRNFGGGISGPEVANGLSEYTVHRFGILGLEYQTDFYTPANAQVRRVTTEWEWDNVDPNEKPWNPRPSAVETEVEDGLKRRTELGYNAWFSVESRLESDWYTEGSPDWLREEYYTFG